MGLRNNHANPVVTCNPKKKKNMKTTKTNHHRDAENFAEVLKKAKLIDNYVQFGNFSLKARNGVKDTIQYNRDEEIGELLNNIHEYTFKIIDGDLQLSLQLYENISNYYRLFAYTRLGDKAGMTFSVNLTTEKETENIIFLTQKIKFAEQYDGNEKLAQAHRRQKQIVLCNILNKLGLEVTDNNDVILGIFDPATSIFINTSAEKFLNDFIVVSLLKGHFQGNKGYELDILPSFSKSMDIFKSTDETIEELPKRISEQKGKRNIPLALRYKVLKKDNCKCVACGASSKDSNVVLHIDHKIPFSLGGLTTLENLQTLCQECNISKSNKFIDE